MYCYEYAFLKNTKPWKAFTTRFIFLQYYAEFGRQKHYVEKCRRILTKKEDISPDSLHKLADLLTPPVNLIMNVEFQTMRKHTKTLYQLLIFFDNLFKGRGKRVLPLFSMYFQCLKIKECHLQEKNCFFRYRFFEKMVPKEAIFVP